MPSWRDVTHGCVHLLYNNWKFHQVLKQWFPSPVPECYCTGPRCWMPEYRCQQHRPRCLFPAMGDRTSETNHLIMGLVSETRTPSLDMSCLEGMAWCSSRPMHSLWSVYCVLCGSIALMRTHWPMYRACIHKANLLKKLILKLIYI
jgi:hypothetical protein